MDIQQYYIESGQGDPILLFHGNGERTACIGAILVGDLTGIDTAFDNRVGGQFGFLAKLGAGCHFVPQELSRGDVDHSLLFAEEVAKRAFAGAGCAEEDVSL